MEITTTTVTILAVVALVISLATAIPVAQSGIITLGKPSGCNYDGSCQGWESSSCADCEGAGEEKSKPQCNDKVDNDGDELIDYPADPGCVNRGDASELNPNIECDDGVDNDLDGAIDMLDDGCSSPTDGDETNCGDAVCEGGETCSSCQADCGSCDSCSDTDGGFNVLVQGTVSGYEDGSPYNNTDFCITNTTMVNEYYCSGTRHYSSSYDCSLNTTSCVSGACV